MKIYVSLLFAWVFLASCTESKYRLKTSESDLMEVSDSIVIETDTAEKTELVIDELFPLTQIVTPNIEVGVWVNLEKGLDYMEAIASKKSFLGDSKISILRINPMYMELSLSSSKEDGSSNKTAPEWSETQKYCGVINAGMYGLEDFKTNMAYMKNYSFVNNSKFTKDKIVAAFNPKDTTVPTFQLIDVTCQKYDSVSSHYNTLVQGIRIMDCNRVVKWSKQNKFWSTSALGEDDKGNALFIFARSPFARSDFQYF